MIVAAACTSGGNGDESEPQADASPLQGGTLRLAVPDYGTWFMYEFGPALDPLAGGGAELFRCCLVRTLYSYNGKPGEEGGGEARPDLAVGMPQVSSDGLTWTFLLRQGLVYAPPFDDTPIVSRDLIRALERMARVPNGLAGYFLPIRGFQEYGSGAADSIVGLEAPDDHTLVVQLDRVTSDLAYRFTLSATAPIPAGASEGHDEDYERFVVASGPYMVEGADRIDFSAPPDAQVPASGYVPPVITGQAEVPTPGSLVLVRNESWDPATDQLRPAYPDRIELTLGGDDAEFARLVDDGEIDMLFNEASPFEQVSQYRDDPELESRVYASASDIWFTVILNPAVPPFDDVHVRRAVASSIDRSALVGMTSRSQVFGLHTGEVATHAAPDVIEGGLLDAFDPYPYDPDRARAEMRMSIYDDNDDGRCDAAVCRALEAIVHELNATPEQAQAVAAGLSRVGIDVELRTLGDSAFHGRLYDPRTHTPIAIGYGWGKGLPVGSDWFSQFLAEAIGDSSPSFLGATPAQLRAWGYTVTSVPSIDDRAQLCLIRRGVAHTECWAELDQYLMTEVVTWLPYTSPLYMQVVSERVVEYSFDQAWAAPALDRIALAPGSE